MIGAFERLLRPFLHSLDPEDAHALTVRLLKLAPRVRPPADDKRLAVRAFGLNFPNPVGMAAGFDKNAEVPDALLRSGFGFVEVGTITPEPQPGNPRPRLFRLDADGGVINRLGFNSQGADAALRRLAARAGAGGIVGINVGANRNTPDRVADYVRMMERFAPVASYITINVSSPNTPGLRDLQQAAVLDDLLARMIDARERVTPQCRSDAGAAEDRARPDACRPRRHCRHRALAAGRWPDRRQHHNFPAGGRARPEIGRKPAGCRAARCFRWERACWRKPTCGPKACFR